MSAKKIRKDIRVWIESVSDPLIRIIQKKSAVSGGRSVQQNIMESLLLIFVFSLTGLIAWIVLVLLF